MSCILSREENQCYLLSRPPPPTPYNGSAGHCTITWKLWSSPRPCNEQQTSQSEDARDDERVRPAFLSMLVSLVPELLLFSPES